MEDNYFTFLDYRAVRRRITARFVRPRWLMIHVILFVTTMTAVWAYMGAAQLWLWRDNFILPALVGTVWSMVLAVVSLVQYRQSAAVTTRREQAVEDEMRHFIADHGDSDHAELFDMHMQLERSLEQQGQWFTALTAFTLLNALSWGLSSFNVGTSWPFQMTLPLAVIIIGGIKLLLGWQQENTAPDSHRGWFARLPLRHIFGYATGVLVLELIGMLRLANRWDVQTLQQGWGIVLVAHIVWSMLLWPVLQRWFPAQATHKPKRSLDHLMLLDDDGELADDDVEARKSKKS